MKKLVVICLALGLSAGALIAAPGAGKSDDKCCGPAKSPAEMNVAKMEEAVKEAEKKGDTKLAASIKKCLDAKKALDEAVKSGDKAAIAKAQENMKKIMEENKSIGACPAGDAKKDAAPGKAPEAKK